MITEGEKIPDLSEKMSDFVRNDVLPRVVKDLSYMARVFPDEKELSQLIEMQLRLFYHFGYSQGRNDVFMEKIAAMGKRLK